MQRGTRYRSHGVEAGRVARRLLVRRARARAIDGAGVAAPSVATAVKSSVGTTFRTTFGTAVDATLCASVTSTISSATRAASAAEPATHVSAAIIPANEPWLAQRYDRDV